MADQKEFKRRLKVLMNKPENLTCVDCNERQPRWASLIKPPPGSPDPMGMGALMCLECSGSHRRLGVHISFVRSINLDSWKEHEVQIMENGGNSKVNAVFEAHLHHASAAKPNHTANGQQRERYIRDKYERRKFYDPSAFETYQAEDDDEEEEEIVMPVRRTTKAPAPVPISRAPSDAARRRAESRQARVAAGGSTLPVDRPSRINVAAPAVDLLDFGSMSSPAPPSAPPPAAPAPPPPQANETLDLFANMTVSTTPAPVPPVQKSNDDILSLFATSNTNNNMMMPNNATMGMGGGQPAHGQMMMGHVQPQNQMMMGGVQMQGHMMMGSGGQSQGQMNPQMIQQQQMVMHQQMTMMHHHQAQNPNHMQGMPQQQQMTMNNNMGAQQYMNPMMMQHNNMQGMMSNGGGMQGMQQQRQTGPTMMMQMMPAHQPQQQQQHMNDGGGFGMGVPMGSGPSISSLQGHAQKEDPFAQFGFNAFR